MRTSIMVETVHVALSYKKIVERRKFMRLPRSNILLWEAEENGR